MPLDPKLVVMAVLAKTVENEDGDLELILILFAKDEVGLRISAVLASCIIVVIGTPKSIIF